MFLCQAESPSITTVFKIEETESSEFFSIDENGIFFHYSSDKSFPKDLKYKTNDKETK